MGFKTNGGYLSPLLLLLLTWSLYKKEGTNLSALGINVKRKNIFFLPLGIGIGILFFSTLLFVQMQYHGINIVVNKNADFRLIIGGIFFLLPVAINEELIFRGYCYKKTIERTGITNANLIFAFLFIVWHWVALNAWGNFGMMLGLITTGFGHLLFATAFLKSATLYFPIGIHLGNNWAQRYLFSTDMGGINTKPSNDVFFLLANSKQNFSQFHSILSFMITLTCFLTFTLIIWKWPKAK